MPTVTKNLIIINVLVFFGTLVAQRYGIDLTNYLGLHFFLASDFNPAQLITYMFMHGGFSHIFFNMFAVFMFGTVLERTWGPKRFLFYYIACGIGAGLIQEGVQYIKYIVDYSHYSQVDIGTGIIPMGEFLNMLTTVGASGAVYAILLAFGMLFPNNQLFIFPLPFPIKAKFFVFGYALIELYAGFANNPGDNVAHFAHLGGMIFGFILIMYWRKKVETMGHIITDLKETFRRGNTFIRLIYINVGIFIIGTLISVILQLFNLSATGIFDLFALPASLHRFILQPWSLLSYMFMHAGFLHILFNMLWLYWFGSLFLYFFSGKHLRGLYVLGGICGGLFYMIAYNIFPYFSQTLPFSTLVGASASVLAIVAATAYREPNYRVQLFLFGAVRLKYLALIVIGTDLLFITSNNAGGHIAHLGGALAGLWFAASLSKGKDVTYWINWFLDGFASLFQKKTWKRKPKMKVHYGSDTSREKDYDYNARKKAQSDEVDRILEKLKKSGYESLTTEEKKSLFDASKR